MEFRYARHTDNIKSITRFYTEILGFQVLFSFENHNGYDGVMLGKPGLDWHLEFTSSDLKANHKFDEEDILIFYPDKEDLNLIMKRIEKNNIEIIRANNPFWEGNGHMIKDPDGFRIIVSNMKSK